MLLPSELPENAILVARSMSPAALLDYDRARLRGIVLEEAGAASHIAIVARALGVPAVSDIRNISETVERGDPIIVDGVTGEVHLLPPPEVEAAYTEKARLRARRQDQYRALKRHARGHSGRSECRPAYERRACSSTCRICTRPARNRSACSAPNCSSCSRRVFRGSWPGRLYRAVLDAAGDKPVTFRTLDIGGDKRCPT